MGTNGVYGFRVDGIEKVTYCHFDSYPDWLGRNLFEWIRRTPADRMRAIARSLTLVPEDGTPTPAQSAECRAWAGDGQGDLPATGDWYTLLRAAQGHPEAWEAGLRYMTDARAFLHDRRTPAEWGYVIDLDGGSVEVFARRPYDVDHPPAERGGLYRLLCLPLGSLPPTDTVVHDLEQRDREAWQAANPQYPPSEEF